ncbi:SNF2 family domain-containing protein [Colletotrichum karsti]|uniref:SNF2 family domain-containing protein n=1 Tax=Colletotrichum karsti TaxID=1095194 RepID=A0A9P6ICW8_9PEZI|nr:SNF2 family domain-containing protein [Colletotrichum karsti]KAF9881097.1 SNF2 family domain-containing protein [Colletotrichum karsti]
MTGRRGPGRPSLAESLASTQTNSPDPASVTGSGRLTRSASSKNLGASAQPHAETSTPVVAKRGRGRPSYAANDSASSAPSAAASADFTSASEDSTPATSNVATPAPSVSADGSLKRTTRSRPSHTNFEVAIPSVVDLSHERALRHSEYSLKPQPKRKRFEIRDSDDDEEDSDTSPDAKVARRLQDEENRKGLAGTSDADLALRLQQEEYNTTSLPGTSQRGRRSLRSAVASTPAQRSSEDLSEPDTDDQPLAARARAGRGRPTKSKAAGKKPAAKKQRFVVNDSEEDDELAGPMQVDDSDEAFSAQGSDSEDDWVEETQKPARRSAAAGATRRSHPIVPSRTTGQSSTATPTELPEDESDGLSSLSDLTDASSVSSSSNSNGVQNAVVRQSRQRRAYQRGSRRRGVLERNRLEHHHPEIKTMWDELKAMAPIRPEKISQPPRISRSLKPFQLEGVAWMIAMEQAEYKGGLLGDEMGLGKTIQAVSLIMSDYPAKTPSLVLVPPVALMQWQSEIAAYTDGTLKTFVYHGSIAKTKQMTLKDLKKYDVIMMSYNSLESMYRHQEKGFARKNGTHKQESLIHKLDFHRVILDEAHSIKVRTTMTAKACFALKTKYRWCLTGTPLQNRIGEFFSLIRFLNITPFASYLCKQCPCTSLEWNLDDDHRCNGCGHAGMQHVSVFNQELLNPIQKFGNLGPGREAFQKLRLMTDRIMLRRLKKDNTDSMELPVKEIYVNRQFFSEEQNDFANSIMTNGQREFDTYVSQGVLLNNYANIFGLIMQMRQVADHPDLILRKNAEGGQNTLVCCICDEPAEDAIRSRCKHEFCRTCARSYLMQSDEPDCPQCHINLAIDLEQPEIEQDEVQVKKSSIINRIKMENWTSSSKIELLVHELHRLRSDNASHKSIIFSQFSSMLQLIEWRLRRAGLTTVMLDGSMSPVQRQASINHFMTKPEVECFLVSLKAGGVALNLTEASRVFIVDPWWNPAAEWQSADRCHRIGQTRPCTITRLCIEDSVESRMVLIQEKKTNMINSTVNADDKAMESLSPEDMQFLFRGT